MANVIKQGGLRLKHALVDQQLMVCVHSASERLGKGDPVKLAGDSAQVTGVPGPYTTTVALCSAGDNIFGVVEGVQRHMVSSSMNLDISHAESGVSTYVLVRKANPMDIYAITEDGAINTNQVGNCAAITGNGGGTAVTQCNATTGQSTVMLDSSTAAASSGALKIIGFEDTPDNTPGSTNSSVLVQINTTESFGAGPNGV